MRVADALHERGRWVRVGLLPVYMRPVTYGQIIDMRVFLSDLEPFSVPDKNNLFRSVFAHTELLEVKMNVVVVAMFRKHWMRKLLGGYVRRRITDGVFKRVEEFLSDCIDPVFFCVSTIFLAGMRDPKMSEDTTLGESFQAVESTTE